MAPGRSVDDAVAEIAERQRVLYGSDLPIPPIAGVAAPPPEPMDAGRRAVCLRPAGLAEPYRRLQQSRRSASLSHHANRGRCGRRASSNGPSKPFAATFRTSATSSPKHCRAAPLNCSKSRCGRWRNGSTIPARPASIWACWPDSNAASTRSATALHGLTPAENLVGFDDAVKALAQKVDLIIAREDPAALQQLETAIGALRGIVSHVASNDTLTKVAEDVRALAAKVDDVANSAASGQAVSALESRIDTLTNALNASAEAGQAVPRDLEKLLSGLIEKLEWVQLTHTDHAALGALEDRIAQLIKRLDASGRAARQSRSSRARARRPARPCRPNPRRQRRGVGRRGAQARRRRGHRA